MAAACLERGSSAHSGRMGPGPARVARRSRAARGSPLAGPATRAPRVCGLCGAARVRARRGARRDVYETARLARVASDPRVGVGSRSLARGLSRSGGASARADGPAARTGRAEREPPARPPPYRYTTHKRGPRPRRQPRPRRRAPTRGAKSISQRLGQHTRTRMSRLTHTSLNSHHGHAVCSPSTKQRLIHHDRVMRCHQAGGPSWAWRLLLPPRRTGAAADSLSSADAAAAAAAAAALSLSARSPQ